MEEVCSEKACGENGPIELIAPPQLGVWRPNRLGRLHHEVWSVHVPNLDGPRRNIHLLRGRGSKRRSELAGTLWAQSSFASRIQRSQLRTRHATWATLTAPCSLPRALSRAATNQVQLGRRSLCERHDERKPVSPSPHAPTRGSFHRIWTMCTLQPLRAWASCPRCG